MDDKEKPIFEYLSYREFLKDRFDSLKLKDRQFSYRALAKAAGLKSPNYIQLVIKGKRNLTEKSITAFSTALKLNNRESSFFRNLVLFTQAESAEARKSFAEHLVKNQGFKNFRPLAESHYHFYTRWYYLAIFEMVASPHFQNDAEWISKILRPQITPTEVRYAIGDLLKLGFLKRSDVEKLMQAEPNLETADEVISFAISQYHRDVIKLGAESIDRFAGDSRDIESLTFRLSIRNVPKIKALIRQFRDELAEAVTREEDSERVYQLNFQFFPIALLTEGLKESGRG